MGSDLEDITMYIVMPIMSMYLRIHVHNDTACGHDISAAHFLSITCPIG